MARVAYGRLARRDRKERHLRAARFLRDVHGEEPDEIAEVLATHYLEAAIAEPDAADVEQIKATARATLEAAGTRAMSLAAGERAAGYFVRAAHLATEGVERAGLLERAGEAAEAAAAERLARAYVVAGHEEKAEEHVEVALVLAERLRLLEIIAGALSTKHLRCGEAGSPAGGPRPAAPFASPRSGERLGARSAHRLQQPRLGAGLRRPTGRCRDRARKRVGALTPAR